MFEQDEDARRYGATSVDNLFFLDYLPAARGDYVKVYLYGLFISRYPQDDLSMAQLSQELGLSESEIESALRYWERRRLVTRLQDNPPRYRFRTPNQVQLSGESGQEADPEFVAFSEDVYALFGDRRKVRPADIGTAWDWVQDLRLPKETVLMLLSYCINTRGVQFSFQSAQQEAVRMRENNVLTAEDAEAYFAHGRRVQDGARAVLRRLGKRRAASQDELALYRKWLDEWRYTPDAILEACSETVKGEPTMAYLDGILAGIRKRGQKKNAAARTGEELRAQLSEEKDEHAALRAFAAALGLKSVPSLLQPLYERLCAQYDPAVVLLVAGEARQAGGDIDTVSRTLETLARRGIATLEETRAYFDEVHSLNQALQPLFDACALRGRPGAGDRALYKKWRSWGFDEHLMLLAAQQARTAERKLAYIDRILQAWHEAGVANEAQAGARTGARQAAGKQVRAQQYTQRQYSDEALNALAVDIMEEARKQDG